MRLITIDFNYKQPQVIHMSSVRRIQLCNISVIICSLYLALQGGPTLKHSLVQNTKARPLRVCVEYTVVLIIL